MTRDEKIVAINKVLDTYKRAVNFLGIALNTNAYEKHVTSLGLGSTLFILDVDLDEFPELEPYFNRKDMPRNDVIKLLKEYILKNEMFDRLKKLN